MKRKRKVNGIQQPRKVKHSDIPGWIRYIAEGTLKKKEKLQPSSSHSKSQKKRRRGTKKRKRQ